MNLRTIERRLKEKVHRIERDSLISIPDRISVTHRRIGSQIDVRVVTFCDVHVVDVVQASTLKLIGSALNRIQDYDIEVRECTKKIQEVQRDVIKIRKICFTTIILRLNLKPQNYNKSL